MHCNTVYKICSLEVIGFTTCVTISLTRIITILLLKFMLLMLLLLLLLSCNIIFVTAVVSIIVIVAIIVFRILYIFRNRTCWTYLEVAHLVMIHWKNMLRSLLMKILLRILKFMFISSTDFCLAR